MDGVAKINQPLNYGNCYLSNNETGARDLCQSRTRGPQAPHDCSTGPKKPRIEKVGDRTGYSFDAVLFYGPLVVF